MANIHTFIANISNISQITPKWQHIDKNPVRAWQKPSFVRPCFKNLGKHYQILKDKGLINDDKLGFLSNDCNNDAIIIREINLSPKCYMYETMDKDENFKCVMKSKGIIQKLETMVVSRILNMNLLLRHQMVLMMTVIVLCMVVC